MLHVPNHALKDMYMSNYGNIYNANSLHYSFIEELIDFINSVMAICVFLIGNFFLIQPQVTYVRMNFKSESCLAVTYSTHFQPLVA